MEIRAEAFEDFAILHLRGEFDRFHCARVQQEIDELVTAGVRHVALNLRMVNFINSTALGAIIKASKGLADEGGRLVVSRPSAFCRDIMEKIQLEMLVPIRDSDVEAGQALFEEQEPAEPEGSPDVLADEATLLFTPTDPGRVANHIPEERRLGRLNPVHRHRFGSNWCGVGRLTALHPEGLRFLWGGGKARLTPFEMGQLLAIGTDLRVKFRLPLLQKGHCQAVVSVLGVEERTDGVKLEVGFKEIDPLALEAVRQYAEDLAFLKQELHTNRAACA